MNNEIPRRHAGMRLSALATLCALAAPAIPALAQDYPARPITVIVPFDPGGTTDIMARLLQKSLGDELGVSVVVDNRAGASGTIGMSVLARATPDGYTLGMTTVGPEVIQSSLRNTGYTNASFDHICGTYDVPLMMMVTRDSPFQSLTSVANYAKANPGKLSYDSSGQGTSLHLSMVMLLDRLKADALHVPYKSSCEMATGLMGKQIMVFNEYADDLDAIPATRSGGVCRQAARQLSRRAHCNRTRLSRQDDRLGRLDRAARTPGTCARKARSRLREGRQQRRLQAPGRAPQHAARLSGLGGL